jgi:hypothetical protein
MTRCVRELRREEVLEAGEWIWSEIHEIEIREDSVGSRMAWPQ